MKRKISLFFLAGVLLAGAFLFTACGGGVSSREKDFIGTFHSCFIEGSDSYSVYVGDTNYIYGIKSYTLEVKSDNTFTLTCLIKFTDKTEDRTTSTGTWTGNKSKDDFGIICFYERENTSSSAPAGSLVGHYLTLTQLDDGRIVAASGVSGFPNIAAGGIIVFTKN